MPLHLVSSNRVETLRDHLSQLLQVRPLTDPFTAELIVVPGMAMARWLNLQLAQISGVAANIDYKLAASWIWQLTSQQLPDVPPQDPLARDPAAWAIFHRLPALLPLDEFTPLRRYLADDAAGIKRWQLAVRIADLFDRYQFYRPDWIRLWSKGGMPTEQAWQALLWRDLISARPDLHRVALLDRLQQKLRSGSDLQRLPERISCFALSSLPPLYVEVLQGLAPYVDIILYQHSPTDQYWADIKDKKALARMRVRNADEAGYYETGNDLLASWGRQGQAFQDLLLSHDALDAAQYENYQDPGEESLLHRLQHDIFAVQEHPEEVVPDDSIQIAVCHSAMRECQVLHDELLRTLQQNPGLQPEDILVMVPRISQYAPYIEAVFGHAEGDSRPTIPWNLSDITLADEHPLIRIFLQLLELPLSRFTFSELMSCLEVPEIAIKFGLDQDACDAINEILQECRVHWGLDGTHKESLGLPAIEENTWRYVERRLLAAYAFGDDLPFDDGISASGYWHDIAPASGVEGGTAQQIGNFLLLLERLRHWREMLQTDRSGEAWQTLLNTMLDDLFMARGEDDDKLQQIRQALDELKKHAGPQRLSRELLIEWLQNALGEQNIRGRFFSGGVTFCGMRPMRSLPFQLICLLGMNDQDFPRREQPVEFDLMAGQWRPGDPRKGDEDRYLLLETILCARQKLYISYTGRSLEDNSVCQPSVLLRQLLDFIDAQYKPLDSDGLMSDALMHQPSMQPFSAHNFLALNSRRSFDRYWCEVARQLREEHKTTICLDWPEAALTSSIGREEAGAEQPEVINLARLRRFLGEPVKYFFNYRLHVFLQDERSVDDEESFRLDGLQSWNLQSRLASDWLRGIETSRPRLQAEGLLPHGSFAAPAFVQIQEQCRILLERIAEFQRLPIEVRPVSVALAQGQVLHGQVQFYPGKGLLHYSPSRFKGKMLLALWVEHLALCAQAEADSGGQQPKKHNGGDHRSSSLRGFAAGESSLLITRDHALRFMPIPREDALWQLQAYANVYQEGMQRPLPVFPETSYAWAREHDDEDKAFGAAWKAWLDTDFSRGEEVDPYVRLVCRDLDGNPLDDPAFAELARLLYAMALENVEEVV